VNFSRVTIYRKGFYDSVVKKVDHYQIPHALLEIEVTENALNEIPEMVVHVLVRLHEIGFVISMDDFGSGYSSLNTLDNLPVQVLKLDRQFLQKSDRSEQTKKVIACVVDIAHTLNLQVVCEGVEQQAHVTFLKDIGCDCGQGYYFSRPVTQEAFSDKYDKKGVCRE